MLLKLTFFPIFIFGAFALTHANISQNSPIIFYYKEKEDLSKHELLRRFSRILTKNSITYIRPYEHLMKEWFIDLKELRYTFGCLSKLSYLNGKLTIEPEYFQNIKKEEYSGKIISEESILKLSIYPEDVKLYSFQKNVFLDERLEKPLSRFKTDYGSGIKCGFLMMKFEDTPIQKELIRVTKEHLLSKNIKLLRADEKWYADDLFENIKTYMHGCSFGIAIFDRIKTNYFNPNVSLEIGYMMALNKPILLLKDNTLDSLHTDLVGKLYHEFDFQNPQGTLPRVLSKWLNDKEI